MSKKPDPYASEEDTRALMRKDTRTPAERKLDRMLEDRGASEQGAEPFLILRQIALELLAEQSAQQEPESECNPQDLCAGCRCEYAAQPAQQEPTAKRLDPDDAWNFAKNVWNEMDRKAMPGIYMQLVTEAIVKHHTSPPAQQQEPFTYYRHYDNGLQDWPDEKTIPLYTTPQAQRTIANGHAKATELLAQCLDEMGYAGWNQPIKDNVGRWNVFSAVLNYLYPPIAGGTEMYEQRKKP